MKAFILIGALTLACLLALFAASVSYTARLGKDAPMYQSFDASVEIGELKAGSVVAIKDCIDTGGDIFYFVQSGGESGYMFELRNSYSLGMSMPGTRAKSAAPVGFGAAISCFFIVSRFQRIEEQGGR